MRVGHGVVSSSCRLNENCRLNLLRSVLYNYTISLALHGHLVIHVACVLTSYLQHAFDMYRL